MMKEGAIIEASNSTKHKRGELAPERYQTKKGNQWYFGLKAHICVDAKSGLIHGLVPMATKEHDLNQGVICSMARKNLYSLMPDIRGLTIVKRWRL
uniref:Transposase IS4-like domain-containing protein n=1 Tax=Aeromonas hydrophila TaxID=644 RepID=A0A346ACV2_AERHY|nr:hypothetical protein [Aeromonas hydrophila]